MYKKKSYFNCKMPAPLEKIKVLVLNASLKHDNEGISNTGELAKLVLANMKKYGISSEIIRLADQYIPVGLKFNEGRGDDWSEIAVKMRDADVIIFATPIWWGGRSSLIQRIIERMDAFDEEHIREGRSAFLNKVAGIVITGSEDGALSTLGTMMNTLTFFNFTLPPECCAYWVGEVGMDTRDDRRRRLRNNATKIMAKNLARNLVFYAQLLKTHPMQAGK